MRKSRHGFLLISLMSGAVLAIAQQAAPPARVAQAVTQLKADFPKAEVRYDLRSGLPQSIRNLGSPTSGIKAAGQRRDPEQIVLDFFQQRGKGLFLMTDPQQEIQILNKEKDPDFPELWIVRVQQVYKHIKVFGAQAVVSVQTEKGVLSIQSTLVPLPEVRTEPKLTKVEALEIAESAHRKIIQSAPKAQQSEFQVTEQETAHPEPELVVFNPQVLGITGKEQSLVWLTSVGTFVFFVDANKGAILYEFRNLPSNRIRETYDDNFGPGPGTLVLNEDNAPNPPPVTRDAELAHNFAGHTYDYYRKMFNRDSFDGHGATLRSHVQRDHLQNAFWNGHEMTYGPGYAGALDVVGHEITHAVTQYSASLVYAEEPGAVNEFFSDFFGEMIQGIYEGEEWDIGEGIPGYGPPHRPLRNMSDPHNGSFDKSKPYSRTNQGQPDQYSEVVHSTDPICASTGDIHNGCVHFNSGILNKAAYLAAAGGSQFGIGVKGIGRRKLEQVLYRTLIVKLSSSSNLHMTAQSAIDACMDLIGSHGIQAGDCREIENAFLAVGLR